MKRLARFNKIPTHLKFRLALSLIFIGIIGLFLFLRVVPGGHIEYTKSWPSKFYSGHGFLADFRPGDRLDLKDKDSLKIIAEPLYFSLFSPRQFDKAKIKIVYKNNLSPLTPIIEIASLKNREAASYEFKSLQNLTIDKLRFSWHRLQEEDNLIVLQKDENYQDAASFWRDFENKKLASCQLNSLSCVAFYNYSIAPNYKIPSYVEIFPLRLDHDLLGGHQIYAYFKGEKDYLKLLFKKNEKNETSNNLKAEVRIFKNSELIEKRTIAVPGSTEFSFSEESLYKIEIIASSDVVIDKIESSSDRLVFNNKINLAETSDNLKLFASSKNVSVSSLETESLGEIIFAGETYNLEKTHSQELLQSPQAQNINEISSLRSYLSFSGNGVFSFDALKMFDPETRSLDRFFHADNYQYLIAHYNNPDFNGDFRESEIEFSLAGADYTDKKYSFLISIPGLSQDKGFDSSSEISNYLAIKEISIELSGKTLWQKIKEIYAK